MFNDYLQFKIHQSRHAELIRAGSAQRLAESLVPKHPNAFQTTFSVAWERTEAWWEGLKRKAGDFMAGGQSSVSDPC